MNKGVLLSLLADAKKIKIFEFLYTHFLICVILIKDKD
ncbi:hypothetical protein RU87_GL001152 [Lactococcus plantarum]|uniref:Uncharacterized protein n=1 Tax=Pseudolactococcus plantarum TaxID=1365 RepID=A0A2A5S0U9_9LACT|nr:hypothetical protein RU87_GL001152 [Lactococcus plantarum]